MRGMTGELYSRSGAREGHDGHKTSRAELGNLAEVRSGASGPASTAPSRLWSWDITKLLDRLTRQILSAFR